MRRHFCTQTHAFDRVGHMKPVFVIDDDDDVREVIVFALENENILVEAFDNALNAYEKLKNLTKDVPGLIIVDYLMPDMNGIEFIDALRKLPQFKNLPIALSSAMGANDPSMSTLKNIIELHKPMDLDDLLNVVRKHCL